MAGSPFTFALSPSFQPAGAALTTSGARLYVADSTGARIVGMAIGPGGQLSLLPGSPYPAGSSAVDVVFGSGDARLYAADQIAGTIASFDVAADGSLTWLATIAAGVTAPSGLTTSPGRELLYVAGSGQIAGFAISPAGALVPLPGFPVAAGGDIADLTYYRGQQPPAIPTTAVGGRVLLATLLAAAGVLALAEGRRSL